MHPFKEQSILTAENKHRQVVGQTDKMEHAYKKALRVSGAQSQGHQDIPEQAVPQFENDRSPKDPVYGSIHKQQDTD